MVAFNVIFSLEASVWSFFVATDSCLLVRATPRETLNLGLPDWMTVAYGVALPLVGVVFGVDTGWRDSEAVRCSSTTSTTLGLGSVAQRGLGVGRVLMDSRKADDGRSDKVIAEIHALKKMRGRRRRRLL
jgi:hypothetical protein